MIPTDFIFIVDSTGSMYSLIHEAKRFMQDAVEKISKELDLVSRFSLISYRDHPPQERTWASKIIANRVGTESIKKSIAKLGLGDGGDAAESGLDGIMEIDNLSWDGKVSLKLAFFIGDAPILGTPEGGQFSVGGDWSKECRCGITCDDALKMLEKHGIDLYGLVVGSFDPTKKSFAHFSELLGSPDRAKSVIARVTDKAKEIVGLFNWSVHDLLPVLEGDPRAEVASLSKTLMVGNDQVYQGIEMLNEFGYTEKLFEEVRDG